MMLKILFDPVRSFPLLLALLLALTGSLALAQESTFMQPGQFMNEPGGASALFQARMGQTPSPSTSVPLEGAVDPGRYIVGPGDVFSVSIGGLETPPMLVTVTADGRLLLPDAGTIQAAGEPLEDVQRRAIETLRRPFRNVTLDVNLAQPRQFFVHVSGAVPVPGRYLAVPVARVASILELAFSDSTSSAVSNRLFRPSLRNVMLIHRDGATTSLDLLRYFATGNTEQNPYLRDGDVISVRAYRPDQQAVFIDGDVPFPGTYDYRSEDTLLDLLALATGTETPDPATTLRLTRRTAEGTVETRTFSAADLLGTETAVPLQPLDHLFIVPEAPVQGSATLEGEVYYPGTYAIKPGETTLQDLVALAGGLKPTALERGAYLERRTLPDPVFPTIKRNRIEYLPFAPTTIRADSLAILQNIRLSDFDFMSRTYFAQELRVQNRLPVNLDAPGSDPTPVLLQDGDRVFVPRDNQSVFVFGQVNRPGYITYTPNQPLQYYIDQAGGRGDLTAGKAYVIEAGTGRYLDAENATIQSGDLIFLDRRDKIADSPGLQRIMIEESKARADARIRTTQTVLQVLSTAATLVTTIILIRNQ